MNLLFFVMAGMLAFGSVARATVYTWQGTGGNPALPNGGTWNTPANWFGGSAAVSASTTDIELVGNPAAAYTGTNNNAGNFKLNILGLSGSATAASVVSTITGGTLEFISNGATGPTINRAWSGNNQQLTITSAIVLTNDLNINGTGTQINMGLAGTGIISGTGGIINNAGGTLALNGSNTFTGGVTSYAAINSGATGALGSGTLTLGDLVKWTLTSAQVVANNIVLSATSAGKTNNVTISVDNASNIQGAVSMNGRSLTLRNNGTAGATISGAISGAGNITGNNVDGNATWTLSGNNTYTGSTTWFAGTLTLSGSNSYSGGTTIGYASGTSGATVVLGNAYGLGSTGGGLTFTSSTNSATLNLNGYSATVGALNGSGTNGVIASNTSGAVTFTAASGAYGGVVKDGSGTLALSKNGTGTLILSASNSYSGGTTIASGTLTMGNAGALGSASAAVAVNGGALNLNGNSATVGALSGSSGALITSGAVGTVTFATNVASGTSTYAGAISNGSGNLGFAKSGAGTLVLSSSNAYSNGTTITAGTLVLGNAYALGGTTGALAVNGGTLDLGGKSVTVGSLSGLAGANITSGAAGALTMTSSFASGTSTYAGSIADGSGVVTFAKSGAGTLLLSSSNAYSGGTVINASGGTLVLGNANALGGAGSLTVASGGTLDLNGNSITVGTLVSSGGTITTNVAGAVILTSTSSAAGGFNGSINDGLGTISLVKTGGGQLTLSGSSNYSGGTTINGGPFLTQSVGAIGSGALSLGAGLKWTLGIVTQSYSNNISIGGANSAIQVDTPGRSTLSGTVTLLTNNLLVLRNASGAGGEIKGVITGTGGITSNTGDVNDNWILSGNNNYTGTTTWGAGTLTLGGSNNTTGGTTIGASGATSSATVVLGNAYGLGATNSALTFYNSANSAILDLNGNSAAVGALSGTGTNGIITNNVSGAATLTSSISTSGTYGGVIKDGSGSVAFAKTGAGKLTLSAVSTYSGNTTINSGTLALSAASANSIASSTKIIVGDTTANSGARLDVTGLTGGAITLATGQTLGGHGTVLGGVTTQSTSVIAPGNSVGTLTLGSLTMAIGSIYNFEFNGTPANDKIIVSTSGGLVINGGGFNLYSEGTATKWLTNGTYSLIGYTGAIAGTGLDSTWTTASNSNEHILNADSNHRYSFGLSGGYVTLTITDNTTATTYTLASAAGASRIVTGGTTAIQSVITNTGTGGADALDYSGLGASATGISGTPASATGLASLASGTASLTFTGGALGVQTITPTVTAATNTALGGAATAGTITTSTVDVVANRTITASSVNLGKMFAGVLSGNATSTLTSTGSRDTNTDLTVASGSTISGGVSVSRVATQTFDGTYTSGSATVSGNFSTSGSKSGSVSVATSGENLSGETDAPVSVGYTADVYQTASLSAVATAATKTTASSLNLTNAASTDSGGQRAGVTVTGLTGTNSATGRSSNFATPSLSGTPSVGTTTIAGSTATIGTVALQSKRLNGSYTETVIASAQYTDTTLRSQATVASQSFAVTASIGGNTSTSRTDIYSADILSGQSYNGFGLTSGVTGGKAGPIVATLLGGTAGANTTVSMSFSSTLGEAGTDSINRQSDILTLSGINVSDAFVLQMSYDPNASAGDKYIVFYDTNLHRWVNAISGNSNILDASSYLNGGQGIGNFQTMSYASYISGTTAVLGDYGYDMGTHTAWAVLDNSVASTEFAVVPEPATWVMIVGGMGMLGLCQRARRRTRN